MGTGKRLNQAHLCVCVIVREHVCLTRAIAGLMGRWICLQIIKGRPSRYSFVKCCLHMYVGVGVFHFLSVSSYRLLLLYNLASSEDSF